MLKIIALQYQNSQIINAEEFESITNALGLIHERNYNDLMVGYTPSWSVYIVEGSDWYRLDNYVNSGVRLDFINFLDQFDGVWGPFNVENFRAVDREDF